MEKVGKNIYIPSKGYKYLTDGINYATELALGSNSDIRDWYDTNSEPTDEETDEREDIVD